MRRLIGLMALVTALGVLIVPASAAAEEIVVEGSTILIEPGPATEGFALSECSTSYMCVWENSNYTGTFSQWHSSNTGCHNHAGNPKLRSGWNRTGYTVRVGGAFNLASGNTFQVVEGNPITGEICWPV